jgi:hypothetical protein
VTGNLGFFQKARLRVRAHEASERWSSHLSFPKATTEESLKAKKVLRSVYEMGFLGSSIDDVPVEEGIRRLLAKVHETLPAERSEEEVRAADKNLAGAYRMGYNAGTTAQLSV